MPAQREDFASAFPDEPGDGAPAGCVPVERADFFFLLAAAFRPPPAGMAAHRWCETLADDLADLAPALGASAGVAVDRLRQHAAGPGGGDDWLVEYSRLFLVPPVEVTLNTGIYLEGGVGGTASQMIRQCFARGGFAPRAEFRDLPDHVALQLEFIGELLERAARGGQAELELADEFVDTFVAGWAAPLRNACNTARDKGVASAAAFGALAQLLVDVLDLEGTAAPAL